MKERLLLSKKVLTDEGIIFVSLMTKPSIFKSFNGEILGKKTF